MQKVFRSTIYQIVALIIVLVLPINLLTLSLSQMLQESSREEQAKDISYNLTLNAKQFNDVLTAATRSLRYLSLEDPAFISMSNVVDPTSSGGASAHLASVKRQMKLTLSNYPHVDMIYVYFPNSEYFVSEGFPGASYRDIRLHVTEHILAQTKTEQWEIVQIDGVYTLMGYQQWNNVHFGTVINLDSMISRLIPQEKTGVLPLLTDDSGMVYTKKGMGFFEENGLTMELLKKMPSYTLFTADVSQTPLILMEIVDMKQQAGMLLSVITVLQWVSVLLFIAVIPLLLLYVRKRIIKPINRLVKAIDNVESGQLDYRIRSIKDGREFDTINRNFNHMLDLVTQLRTDAFNRELEKKDIQIRYLNQQIQPHFFLNAMNIIYSYEPNEYPLIQRMVACISKYFRYIVKANAMFVTLEQEMDHIRNYFEIQKVRFEKLFSYEVECRDDLACALIPPLLVQNFAENAIKYSLKASCCTQITVRAALCDSTHFSVTITDTGDGISDELLQKIEEFQQHGQPQPELGVGIQNSIERLKLLYDDHSSISFCRNSNPSGTTVLIVLPLHRKEESNEGFVN